MAKKIELRLLPGGRVALHVDGAWVRNFASLKAAQAFVEAHGETL